MARLASMVEKVVVRRVARVVAPMLTLTLFETATFAAALVATAAGFRTSCPPITFALCTPACKLDFM